MLAAADLRVCSVFCAAGPMACSAVASIDRIPDVPVDPVGDVASAGAGVVVVAAAAVTIGAVVEVLAPSATVPVVQTVPWIHAVRDENSMLPTYDYYVPLMSCRRK